MTNTYIKVVAKKKVELHKRLIHTKIVAMHMVSIITAKQRHKKAINNKLYV